MRINQYRKRKVSKIRNERSYVVIKIACVAMFLFQFFLT